MSYILSTHRAGRMSVQLAAAFIAASLVACTAIVVRAQAPTAIYPGGSPESAGIKISSAGSGVITPDTTHVYAGGGSLKLVTQGSYQGGILRLVKSYDLGPILNNKFAYIEVAFIPPTPPSANGGSGGGPGGGKFGGQAPSGVGGANTNGQAGSPYGSLTGSNKDSSSTANEFKKAKSLENVRLVFVTTSGRMIDKRIPVSYANTEAGWKVVSVPVSAISGLSQGDANIKEVRVYGDTEGTLYLGKIGVVIDTTAIMIEPMTEKTVTANQTYSYTASAHGGTSPLVYSWDWDDRDGIQDEAQGKSASHMFRKPGDYKVTVTVIDPYGVKAPASTKFNVHIP
jgi:hypothetical protein